MANNIIKTKRLRAFTPLEVRGYRQKHKKDKLLTGFTLIELLIVIAIIGILSTVVLFSVNQYISRGKDASVMGNLAILVAAGEVYYDYNTVAPNSYEGFCESNVVQNSLSQIISSNKRCLASANAWAACAKLFADPDKAYCVDSRGIKKEIPDSSCIEMTICPS